MKCVMQQMQGNLPVIFFPPCFHSPTVTAWNVIHQRRHTCRSMNCRSIIFLWRLELDLWFQVIHWQNELLPVLCSVASSTVFDTWGLCNRCPWPGTRLFIEQCHLDSVPSPCAILVAVTTYETMTLLGWGPSKKLQAWWTSQRNHSA